MRRCRRCDLFFILGLHAGYADRDKISSRAFTGNLPDRRAELAAARGADRCRAVFDDIVLLVAMKTQAEIGSRRELRILKATISVLFLVAGTYFGGSGSVADADMKTALAALMGIVALGGFAVQQWLKYQHQTLKYHMELAENIYFRNVNNNAGIFDYLIATAEDQETKEAALAYHFIRKAEVATTATEIAGRVETWLAENFAVNVDFKIADALDTLDRFGLVRREGDRLFVPSLEA